MALRDYFWRDQGWNEPSADQTAMRRGVGACARIWNAKIRSDAKEGKPVDRSKLKKFSEAANAIAPSPPKSRRSREYIELRAAVGNLCGGTLGGLRLFVEFVILAVRGLPDPKTGSRIANKLWKNPDHQQAFSTASSEEQTKLLHTVLHELNIDTHGIRNFERKGT